jgi:hypothetical protein
MCAVRAGQATSVGRRSWPAGEQPDAGASLEGRALAAAHAAVEEAALAGPVVAEEEHEGVLRQLPLVEPGKELPDVPVDVLHHAAEAGRVVVESGVDVALLPLLRRAVGGVRRVGRQVAEEGLARFAAGVDPREGAVEENVGAEALGPLEGAVVADHGVEIVVVRHVAAGARIGLADAAAAMDEDLVEAPPAGLVGVFVAEVPLAEDARGVARRLERLREGEGLEAHALALEDRVGHPGIELVPSRHDRAARGRAGGADLEVREPERLPAERVESGRADVRVAGPAHVAQALVVGHDEDDIGAAPREGGGVGLCGAGQAAAAAARPSWRRKWRRLIMSYSFPVSLQQCNRILGVGRWGS